MKCPHCGFACSPQFAFCPLCATPLVALTKKGSVPSDTAAVQALKRLAPAAYAEQLLAARGEMAGERRVVTILFFDVKGSSAMARDLDPEDDPKRACRAALQIVPGAQAYAQQLEQKRGIAGFKVGVGIQPGLPTVDELGCDLRVRHSAVGEALSHSEVS